MRIAVTGSSGFIGRRLLPLLSQHDVLRVNRNRLHEVSAFAPDTVVHLAWPGVYGPGRYDADVQSHGFTLTRSICRRAFPSCKRFIGVGSQAETTQPSCYYALCKLASRIWANAAADENGSAFAWARLYSVYGPGEYAASFLSSVTRELLAGGNPALTDQNVPWDYLYVDDAAKAILYLVMAECVGGVYEIASGETVFTQDVAGAIRDKIAPHATLRIGARSRRPTEIKGIRRTNITRMLSLGWGPTTSLSDGLDSLIRSIQQETAK